MEARRQAAGQRNTGRADLLLECTGWWPLSNSQHKSAASLIVEVASQQAVQAVH